MVKVENLLPPRLIESIVCNQCVPFIGAGLSQNIPNWQEFANMMKSELGKKCKDVLMELDYYTLASLYAKQFSYRQLIDLIIKPIREIKVKPSKAHHLIVKLPSDTIITTNFDTLLESACYECSYRPISIIDDSTLSQYDKTRKNILHMHGSIENQESIVFTLEDYLNYSNTRPLLLQVIRTLAALNSFLFIGFSFRDQNVQQILSSIHYYSGKTSRDHYIIFFDVPTYWKDYCKVNNVEVIDLSFMIEEKEGEDQTACLCRYLTSLQESISRVI